MILIQFFVFILVYVLNIIFVIRIYENWDYILKLFHFHIFNKPIFSKYVDFNNRDIIFECRCGSKKCKRIFKEFSDEFPIQTSFLCSDEEFEKILNSK